jgi:hypothetical protein
MTTHQHFSLGDRSALLFSAAPSIYEHLGVGGTEQLEDAPE